MPGTKSSDTGWAGAIRLRPRGAATAAGTGVVAMVIVAVSLAGLLGGKGSAKPVSAEGAHHSYPQPASGTYHLPANAVSLVEGAPASALAGNAIAQLDSGQVAPPEALPSKALQLSAGGHPEIMFICAEYWPQCAAERWPLVMALSKFGTFSNLQGTASSSGEADPDTPSFSFYGATYTSKYLTLDTDELESNVDEGHGEFPLLQPPTAQEMTMLNTWDLRPYTSTTDSIPFAYMGGKFLLTSAQYSATAISHLNFQTAAGILTSGKSTVSKNAEAAAGYLIGDFCALTHDQPTSVCSQLPYTLVGITTSERN
jgi:hypothetical protein